MDVHDRRADQLPCRLNLFYQNLLLAWLFLCGERSMVLRPVQDAQRT